jgi:hypothetical protein
VAGWDGRWELLEGVKRDIFSILNEGDVVKRSLIDRDLTS